MQRAIVVVLLLVSAPALAESFPSCVRKVGKASYKEPVDLKALIDCQKKKIEHFTSVYAAQHGRNLSNETLERWQELQRREVRDFIRRHPDRSIIEGDGTAEEPSAKGEPGKAAVSTSSASGLKALEQDLWERSDQGRNGVTPEMAAQIIKTITEQQGGVSSDMTDLLNAVQKDGTDLTEPTIRKLRSAAKKADASGLDLGVQPDVKGFLLQDNPSDSSGTN